MAIVLPPSFFRHQFSFFASSPTGPALQDKVIVLTGATSGIGYIAAEKIAALSPSIVILAVRNTEAGDKLAQKLKNKHGEVKRIEAWKLDMTSKDSIEAFVKRANEPEAQGGLGRIDVLFNNAGINPGADMDPMKRTEDGYDRVVQTNVISPFLLGLLLVPLLRKSAQPKLIFTGSDTHVYANTKLIEEGMTYDKGGILGIFADEDKYNNTLVYMESKLLLHMATRSLMAALPDIIVINTNPGLCRTQLMREFRGNALVKGVVYVAMLIIGRPAEHGARALVCPAANATESWDYWAEGVPWFSESIFLSSSKGTKATAQFWGELKAELNKLHPGVTDVLRA